jgi:hypothetical protein
MTWLSPNLKGSRGPRYPLMQRLFTKLDNFLPFFLNMVDVCPDRCVELRKPGFFISSITYILLLYIVVKMDGEIWPGNVQEGERVVTRIRPTTWGRPGVVQLA